ncbi:COMPASS component SWD2 [Nematocida minor]|uniref:COMPASS component SWD2 n=1 Tax=Nematocida minor TaxID=1912983 RepID=UPI002220F51F|nr:COMPASS component SWD2 [Nematocida minor]KAI5191773.1 COMPASS component SWD2 [Nematocida minor]
MNSSISESALISYAAAPMSGSVVDASYAKSGELLACALDSGDLVFHNAVKNKQFAPLKTSAKEPFLVEFLDSELLVHTSGANLEVVNLKKEEYVSLFSAHTSPVYSVSTSSMFRNTISAASNEAYMWDIREKNPHAKIPVQGKPIVKYSPDGKIFMILFEERNEMALYDVRSYTAGPYKTKKIAASGYSDMHFSPDGFGMVLFQEDGFSIADGFSGDVTLYLPSEFSMGGCFTQDSRSFIYTTGPSEISMATIPETKSVPIFSVNDGSLITSLRYNPCFEQIAVIHKQLTFLQNSN